jgi:DNA replication protein DnaC
MTDEEYLNVKSTIINQCPKCVKDVKAIWMRSIDRVGPEFQRFTFDQFEVTKGTSDKKETCQSFAVSTANEPCALLLFSREPGVGKTHLGVATVREWLLNHDVPVRWPVLPMNRPWAIMSDSQILEFVRKTYRDESYEDEGEALIRFGSYPILMIDDLGKYTPRDGSFAQRVLFEIINMRWIAHKATVITTNKSGEELQEYLGAATFDRICGMTKNILITMPGTSHRRE